jgi:hypothetical protein
MLARLMLVMLSVNQAKRQTHIGTSKFEGEGEGAGIWLDWD